MHDCVSNIMCYENIISQGPLSTYSLLPYHVTKEAKSCGQSAWPVFLILWCEHGITICLLKLESHNYLMILVIVAIGSMTETVP